MRSSYINPGDKVSISVIVSDGPKRSYMSYIDTITDEQTLLIYTPIFKGQVIRLSTYEDYEFIFYAQTGLYRADGKVVANLVENNVAIVKIQIGRLESIQRREFYRVNTTFEFTYTRPMLGADEAGNLPLYPATAENLSGGGMCFLSPTLLSEEEPVYCTLPLKDQTITVEAVVLHTDSPDDSREIYGMYEYRARFYFPEKRDQEAVMQFVFAKQREILLRRKMQFESVDSVDDRSQGSSRRR
ncbi:flagellar brake protein [Faecalispora anaeroviscerum]|uniref:flagellar brake protein n=1 Tax=Faecalispora anaeroviscerum TaxID=2991836 RepID=UPI0024B9D61B|nr:PilZ domain-containing protein [Faecalispora anaeroviscerum]